LLVDSLVRNLSSVLEDFHLDGRFYNGIGSTIAPSVAGEGVDGSDGCGVFIAGVSKSDPSSL